MKLAFNVKEIAPCLFTVLVDILGFSIALPIITALFTTGDFLSPNISEHVRYAYLAIGLSLYPFFMFFGASFMGDLSDIIGRRKVLLLCMAGFCLGFTGMGIAVELRSLVLLFIGRALTGITAASLPVTMAAISDLSTPANKATHMSFVVLFQNIGLILGPLLGGLLSDPKFVSFFNDAFPLFVASIFSAIAFFWLAIAFKESFVSLKKKIHPLRIILVFVQVAKHPAIRTLTASFFLRQLGIGLFFQLILIFLQRNFNYTLFEMGIFNSYMGLWLGLGIFFIPYLSRHFRIEWVACSSITILSLIILSISMVRLEWIIWILIIPFAISGTIAWSATLTAFSQAVDKNTQGWALGITGSIVALGFMITGFSPNFIPHFGVMPLIGLGGILSLFGSLIMYYYCRKYVRP